MTSYDRVEYHIRYKNFHLNVCRPCLSTWIISTWHYKTVLDYIFLIFFECLMHIWISVKPNYDQHLNNFETWKWKTKSGSFLVTPKWSFYEVLENFMFQIQNLFSSFQETRFETRRYETRYMKFHLNVCRPCLLTRMISRWHYKTVRLIYIFLMFF